MQFISKLISLIVISGLTFATTAFAKTIDMYDQPASTAKKVGTIDVSAGVMPIFSPKGSDWVKVADPKNGNVGWVKSTELSNGSPTTFSFTQKVIEPGKESSNYQVFEFGNSSPTGSGPTKEMLQKMQAQQLLNQQSAQQSIQKIINELNSMYQQQSNFIKESGFPVFMPIIVIPSQKTTPSNGAPKSATPAAENIKK